MDATDKILGRLASTIAIHIRGKNLATYTPSVDMGAFVIVVCNHFTGLSNNVKLPFRSVLQHVIVNCGAFNIFFKTSICCYLDLMTILFCSIYLSSISTLFRVLIYIYNEFVCWGLIIFFTKFRTGLQNDVQLSLHSCLTSVSMPLILYYITFFLKIIIPCPAFTCHTPSLWQFFQFCLNS